MSTTTNRTEFIKLRVSPAEKALIAERAGGAQRVSNYLRSLGLGGAVPKSEPPEPGHVAAEHFAPGPDHAARVDAMAMRMPRRAAQNVVRREEQRERARGALG